MPSDTPQERAKKGNARKNKNKGKGIQVTVEVKSIRRKPKKRS